MHIAAGEVAQSTYHDFPQIRGQEVHAAIDEKRYSNRKNVIQSLPIYSEELQVLGKIDTFSLDTNELVERKAKIRHVYEGYLMQLYAQYYCLLEIGYLPKKLALYSMLDNRKYPIAPPSLKEKLRLKAIISEMQKYTVKDMLEHECARCANNIYSPLSW